MKPAATALLLNWRRSKNAHAILDSLRSQSVPIEVFLWDNTGGDEFGDKVDLHISSSVNLVCAPRWYMAKWASAPVVFTLDDDLAPKHSGVIEKALGSLPPGGAVGYEGVRLVGGKHFRDCEHLRAHGSADRDVDVIKGRFIMMSKETASGCHCGEKYSIQSPKMEDDILASSQVAGPRILPASLHCGFRDLPPGGHSLCADPAHSGMRDEAVRRYMGHE